MGWEVSDFLFASLLGLNALFGAGWVWWFLKRGRQWDKAGLLTRLLTAIALSILIALATIPSEPPLQPHHSFGIGLLSSFLGASIAFWLGVLKSRIWLGYLGVFLPFSVPLVFQSGDPFPSLFGIVVGKVLVWFCLGSIWNSYGLITVTIAVSVGLARLHDRPTGISHSLWQSLPLALGIAGWLSVGLLESWQRYWQRKVSAANLVFTFSILLILSAIFMTYWGGDWRFVLIVFLTCLAAFIALEAQETELRYLPVLLWVGLLVISFATIPESKGFSLLSGYGASLAAVSLAWLAKGQNDGQNVLWQGAVLLVAFAFFRLFAEVYPLRVPRADLYTHYTFVGFLLGAVVPLLLARWMEQGKHFFRELATGFWAASVPVALGAIWGVKAVVGYLAGSIAALLLVFPLNLPALLAGFASSLPLTALVEPASDLPRRVRMLILLGIAFTFALTLLVDYLFHRHLKGDKKSRELS